MASSRCPRRISEFSQWGRHINVHSERASLLLRVELAVALSSPAARRGSSPPRRGSITRRNSTKGQTWKLAAVPGRNAFQLTGRPKSDGGRVLHAAAIPRGFVRVLAIWLAVFGGAQARDGSTSDAHRRYHPRHWRPVAGTGRRDRADRDSTRRGRDRTLRNQLPCQVPQHRGPPRQDLRLAREQLYPEHQWPAPQ